MSAVEEANLLPAEQQGLEPKNISVPQDFFTNLLLTMQEMANNQSKAMQEMSHSQTKALGKIIEEIRKPPHDPIREAQRARAQKTKEQAQEAFWMGLVSRSINCAHLREDGSSAVAWAEQSDMYGDYPELCEKMNLNPTQRVVHIQRGICQHCQTLFSPRREECVSDEVHKRYAEMRRIPTGRGQGQVNYVS